MVEEDGVERELRKKSGKKYSLVRERGEATLRRTQGSQVEYRVKRESKTMGTDERPMR